VQKQKHGKQCHERQGDGPVGVDTRPLANGEQQKDEYQKRSLRE
jgi:hypothetical protein